MTRSSSEGRTSTWRSRNLRTKIRTSSPCSEERVLHQVSPGSAAARRSGAQDSREFPLLAARDFATPQLAVRDLREHPHLAAPLVAARLVAARLVAARDLQEHPHLAARLLAARNLRGHPHLAARDLRGHLHLAARNLATPLLAARDLREHLHLAAPLVAARALRERLLALLVLLGLRRPRLLVAGRPQPFGPPP